VAGSPDRPILIFGTGRSGTTIFMRLLAAHPDVGWFSNYVERWPRVPQLAALSRLLDVPWLGQRLAGRGGAAPHPAEALRTLRHITRGRFQAHAVLDAGAAEPRVAETYRRYVVQTLRWQGKTRYLQKHTGFPRVRYLDAIFRDARFVHVIRDGRAVVNSLRGVPWWSGTLDDWWWGPMPPGYREEYEVSNRDPLVLGAIQWKRLIDLAEAQLAALPAGRSMTVNYTRLVAAHLSVMEEVRRFSELQASQDFERRLAAMRIRNADDRWRAELSAAERATLERSLGAYLARYGFD
jgi:hypothetical protein